MSSPAYQDPTRPVDERTADLLGRMTLDEKIAQLGGIWLTALVSGARLDPEHVATRLKDGIGHVTRIGASTGLRPQASAQLLNEIQRVVIERTRLGIPVVVHEESTAGFCARDATVFPQAIGLASTWDEALIERVAGVIRRQMLAVGARHTLAPVLDVARDPRWGRVEETYGEDPYLCGRLGTAYVRGLQTADLRHGVIATGKHFLGYGLSEGGMNHAPVQLGPRELREVFAEPFAAAIRDAGLASIMNSYASVDGLPCASSAAILDDLLRGVLGFDGVVVADYYSVMLLIAYHRVAGDAGEAAARALAAGLDLELPAADCYAAPLKAKVEAGEVSVVLVDRAVQRVLASKFKLGLFEQPYVDAAIAAQTFDTPADRALAREAAAASVVLLRNEGNLLPLRTLSDFAACSEPTRPPEASALRRAPEDGSGVRAASGPAEPMPAAGPLRRIAVLGPAADDVRLLQGDYHYPAHIEIVYESGGILPGVEQTAVVSEGAGIGFLPEAGGAFQPGPYFTPHVTPLAGLRAALGASAQIVHVPGCAVTGDDDSGIAAAVDAAQDADVALLFVGGRSGLRPGCTVGEARDATDLSLTGLQPRLIEAVVASGTPTVVILISGRVHAIPAIAASVPAIVQAWCPGEEGGNAIADVLCGKVDPSGRLPISMPRSVGQVPLHHDHRAGGGRSMFYGDYTDAPPAPLFPFGHGLSYTTFAYGPLSASAGSTRDPVQLALDLANTGTRCGHEVVQLYVRDELASVARPVQQLVGFARLRLDPGQTRRIAFIVHPSRLAFYDEAMRFVTEPGSFTFSVGASSTDIRSSIEVALGGTVTEYRQREIVATQVQIE